MIIDKKMTICFFGNASSSHMIKWAGYFSDMGHNVHLISVEEPETTNLRGIKIHILKRWIPFRFKPIKILVNLPFSVIKIRKMVKEIHPDIISAHYATTYGMRAVLSGFHPFLLTVWGSDILVNPGKNKFLNWLTRKVLKSADLITCDAQHMKVAMKKLGTDESKIKIINFGVDTERFSPKSQNEILELKKQFGLENCKTIVSLKWPDPLSDYETLIKAGEIVVKKHPDVKFVILGPTSFPEYFEELKKMANEKLGDRFQFIGSVLPEKVPNYLNAADIYVCTSLTDAGLASSTAEAMACGLPPVITNYGDNPSWVKDKENGLLFNVSDHISLAEKLNYILDNMEEGKRFGEKSRLVIEERNSYKNEMGKMEKIYDELVTSKNRKYQICKKCIMDTSDPKITFDENGICSHCKDYENQNQYLFSEKELEKVVEKIKKSGEGKKYDCVMGVSGGVDSCMSAYYAKKYGLRPLAVHIDNGWNSEISQSNIERTLRKLGIDLYTHVIDWEEFKDLQISFLKASVANIDYPYDHAITAMLFNKAGEMGLKYIIYGTNIKTEFIMPREWGYNSWDLRHLKSIYKRFGENKEIKTLPTIPLWKLIYFSLFEKIRIFRILDFVNYNKKESKEFLKKEFGWQDYGAKHCESIYTKFFIGWVLPKKFGFNRNRAWLSTLILSGQLTREEALIELEDGFFSSQGEMEESKSYVIKKLGLTEEEFEKIMDTPVKNHREYPNNAFFLDRSGLIIRTARKILRNIH